MQLGWPADLTWYTLIYNWQTLIAGALAIVAGYIAYIGSVKQVKEMRAGVERRKFAYAVIAALEAQRLEREAKRQIDEVVAAAKEPEADGHVETRYTLSRIEVREVLRSEWQELGLISPETAFTVYHLIDSIEQFNNTISPREQIYGGAAHRLLKEIVANAQKASKSLTDEVKKT